MELAPVSSHLLPRCPCSQWASGCQGSLALLVWVLQIKEHSAAGLGAPAHATAKPLPRN